MLISRISGLIPLVFSGMAWLCTAAAADQPYSPGVGADYPKRLLWGDTHLHTSWSVDAWSFGNTVITPEDAFRFARGEQLIAHNRMPVKLKRPLDFLVVSDHAEYLGIISNIASGSTVLTGTTDGARWARLLAAGQDSQVTDEFVQVLLGQRRLDFGEAAYRSIWQSVAATADRMNQPGVFTAFSGFEWTSMPNGNNLHRVVIFADGADRVSRLLPLSAIDSDDPQALWAWMANYEQTTGGRVLAIPHNGNLSNGKMFEPLTAAGQPISAEYARKRARWEPLYEVTQVKGDAETHPLLSPDDAYADYETWDFGNTNLSEDKQPGMLRFEYARSALRLGLELQSRLGVNPFQFGLQGATDIHTGFSTADDNNFFGKFPDSEPGPKRLWNRMGEGHSNIEFWPNWRLAASGYTAVWARNNSRDAIFSAMQRREVYATTGPRIRLRYFAGWNFSGDDITRPDWVRHGYRHGVPMGAILRAPDESMPADAPTLLIMAAKDPEGANLARLQVIKGWLDGKNQSHERVYDVALGTGIPTRGSEPSSVDLSVPTWTNTLGSATLQTAWTDPDYDPRQRAFYYVRVIEIPTPRWSAYDAAYFKLKAPPLIPMIHQERVYGSPIWVEPAASGGREQGP